MPLPPAPTQRASRLTHKAFEASADTDIELPQQGKAARPSATSASALPSESVRPPRGERKVNVPISAPGLDTPQPAVDTPSNKRVEVMPKQRSKRKNGPTKLFVLDTNVLMHDPMSLFRFEEHDVFLPMIVLEELDGHKKGMTEVARNARQASRSLDALASAQGADLGKGSPLNTTGYMLSLIHI